MPEHHFSVWGRELLPNPLMTAVDLAARTKRIRIGLAAAIVTFWHPLRAAEDIALLDQLTGGRVEIGFGRGNYGLEASNLNPDADPNDQARYKLVFDEAVSVIKAALTQERFSFKGKVYQFPAPGFRADRAHTVKDPEYVDYLDPKETLPGEQEAALKKQLTYEFVRDRSVYFGPPEKIVQQVLHLHRETGISSVIFKTSWAGLPHAAARESVHRLGTEVIPAIRAGLRADQRAVAAE
jgi:Luciferase-like monooxygenase